MSSNRKTFNRRSFVTTVAGAALGGGAFALLATGARAQRPCRANTGYSDTDAGEIRDPGGCGRPPATPNTPYTGVTDADGGADREGYGRGVRNAPGRGAPLAPLHGYTGCSDSDRGTSGDPGNAGRHCGGHPSPRSNTPTHTRYCTDTDRGNNADLPQQGRRC